MTRPAGPLLGGATLPARQRHGGVRFATHAQLTLEQRMLALAQAGGVPRMDRAEAERARPSAWSARSIGEACGCTRPRNVLTSEGNVDAPVPAGAPHSRWRGRRPRER
jgi:hypothetical protein